ncbi:MAG: hypothetical protein LCH84_08845 [Gemmatimonadetes bacterium]|nr:hypothetical protein [Gemmatimonadota bacterium]
MRPAREQRVARVLGARVRARVIGVCVGGAVVWSACSAPPAAAPPPAPAPEPAVTAPAPPVDALPAGFRAAFADADARARALVYGLQCTSNVARLRAGGTFGAAAAAPKAIHCERTADGVPVGGVYDIDSSFRTVRRLALVRLDGGGRVRYTEPVDTARLARGAKLARDVNALVAPAWRRRNRPFTVLPIAANGAVEAWVLPRATRARAFVTGGDVGYQVGADGTPTLVADRTATWTQLTLPPTGPLVIYSSVRDVAAVADLVTARWYTDLGRSVSVSTPAAVSALVAGLDSATGGRVVWEHAVRR